MGRLGLSLGALLYLAVGTSSAASITPDTPLCREAAVGAGIVREGDGASARFVATGEAKVVIDDTDGLQLAADEARLLAMAALASSKDVPTNVPGELRGAVVLATCRDGRAVRVVVAVQPALSAAADEARAAMERSILSAPAANGMMMPSIENLGRSDFDRLMRQ